MRSNSISVEFPSWKYSTQLSDSQPNVTSAQVFARNNFFKLNEMMCKTGAKSATGNDAINEQQVNLSISQTASAHARLGVVKESDGEFQVCSLSQVNNNLAVSNRL